MRTCTCVRGIKVHSRDLWDLKTHFGSLTEASLYYWLRFRVSTKWIVGAGLSQTDILVDYFVN